MIVRSDIIKVYWREQNLSECFKGVTSWGVSLPLKVFIALKKLSAKLPPKDRAFIESMMCTSTPLVYIFKKGDVGDVWYTVHGGIW